MQLETHLIETHIREIFLLKFKWAGKFHRRRGKNGATEKHNHSSNCIFWFVHTHIHPILTPSLPFAQQFISTYTFTDFIKKQYHRSSFSRFSHPPSDYGERPLFKLGFLFNFCNFTFAINMLFSCWALQKL
jgi:hypothetical protein